MFERVARLHTALEGADKAELGLLQNAYVEWTNTFSRDKCAANRKEWVAAKAALAETVERLWPQAFPAEAPKSTAEVGAVFKGKAEAFAWYVDNGGQRQKSSFYAVIPAEGKKVSRLAVSELLRKERPTTSSAGELDGRKQLAETLRSEADARTARVRADEAERVLDNKWMLRENAEELILLWTDYAFNACIDRTRKIMPAMIHSCGGDQRRLTELGAVLEQAFDDAYNDLAGAGEITGLVGEVE